MTIDWTSLSGNGSIQRFAKSLRVALHDKRCEQDGAPLLFFYDTAVVVRMIKGFEQFRDERRPISDPRNLLVRSLLSSGYLGRVSLLRPHALELHQILTRKEAFRVTGTRGSFRKRLRRFLETRGVAELFGELVTSTQKDNPESVQNFLSQMQQIAPSSFVSIELANGSWQQRLTRLHKMTILRFEGDSTELREVLRDPMIWKFKDMIESGMKRLDEGLSLIRLRDAAALSIIYQMVQRFEAGEKIPQVRFFTEAAFLKEAWERNPEMVKLLSYSNRRPLGRWSSEELFVVREVDYFILRAAFEALRFPEVELRAHPVVSMEELLQVSEELDDLVDKAHSEVEDYLNSRRLGPRLLAEHLQDFSSLSFLSSIWMTYEPPPLVRELVEGLEEVWKFGHEEEIEEALQNRIRQGAEEIQDTLKATVKEVDVWFETLDNVRDRVSKVIPKYARHSEIPPNPDRDLGIARWGLELSPTGESQFKSFVRPLLSQDEEEWHQGCIDLTTAVLDVGDDIEKCVVLCAILWWLNGFKTLCQTIERTGAELMKGGQELPVGLTIMKSAAWLQTTLYDPLERESLIEAVIKRVEALPNAERHRYYVGISYLYYRAWSSETHDKTEEVTIQNRDVLDRWISESFSWAERAEALLYKDSLLWAFAVNICAYVGVAAEIEEEKTDRYIRLLGDLEKRYNLWNYRFADTLSYYYLLLAERRNKQGAEPSEVCRLLRTSAVYFAGARNCFADPTIPAHRNQLIQLSSRVGCTDVEIPEF